MAAGAAERARQQLDESCVCVLRNRLGGRSPPAALEKTSPDTCLFATLWSRSRRRAPRAAAVLYLHRAPHDATRLCLEIKLLRVGHTTASRIASMVALQAQRAGGASASRRLTQRRPRGGGGLRGGGGGDLPTHRGPCTHDGLAVHSHSCFNPNTHNDCSGSGAVLPK